MTLLGTSATPRPKVPAAPRPEAVDVVASRLDIRTLQAELARILWTGNQHDVARAEVASFIARLTNAVAVAIFDLDAKDKVEPARLHLATSHLGQERPIGLRLGRVAQSARRSARVEVERRGDLTVVAIPVMAHGKIDSVLAAGLIIGDESLASFVVILQLIAGHVGLWETNQSTDALETEAAQTAALLELLTRLLGCQTVREAATAAVNAVREHLGCDCVAIGLAKRPGCPARLVAVSSVADLDGQADLARLLEAVIDEARLTHKPVCWSAGESEQAASLAVTNLATRMTATEIRSEGWPEVNGKCLGAWVAVGTSRRPLTAQSCRLFAAVAQPVAAALASVRRGEMSRVRRILRTIAERVPLTIRSAAALTLIGIAITAFIPIPYRVSCDCTLEPVLRRFVAVPHAGVFEKSLVEPGDLVQRGQALARMDGREIQWELAGITAEQRRAGKGHDVNLAASKVAAAQMDALELERLSHRERLLQNRLANLEIKSPIDGIVIAGDLKRSEGAPLSIGQPLFEIGPVERMVAELELSGDQLAHVAVDQLVDVEFEAFAGETWSGRVNRIHPRSETRAGGNFFIAEVVLSNDHSLLRPGMHGRAKITTDPQPIGWIILHGPWRDFLHAIGW